MDGYKRKRGRAVKGGHDQARNDGHDIDETNKTMTAMLEKDCTKEELEISAWHPACADSGAIAQMVKMDRWCL